MKQFIKIIVSTVSVMLASSIFVSAEDACNELIQTQQGAVVGVEADTPGACVYKGIPYAAAPTDELRWRPPQPPPHRKGTMEESIFGPICPQEVSDILAIDKGDLSIGEDCLYLNIWKPDKPGTFPVMLWIHGGGFVMGTGSNPVYHGGQYATREDVIIVTINYRLGALGFLGHPDLIGKGAESNPGNYGLLDQIEALKWVKENISNFGGDPNNVTIFGQSAGGFSICYLLVSPLVKGLFHRAILQSGGCMVPGTIEKEYKKSKQVAENLKCNEDKTLECMRSKTADEILEASSISFSESVKETNWPFGWWPYIDGVSLVEQPIESLRSGNFNQVPILIGYTRDEAKLVLVVAPKLVKFMPKMFFKSVVKKLYGKDSWESIKKLYPPENYSRHLYALLDFMSDMSFGCTSYEAALAVSKYQPTYYYRFDYDDHNQPEWLGVAHAFDLPFVFNTLNRSKIGPLKDLYNDAQIEKARPMADAMMTYWANFAKNANPNSKNLMEWPAFNQESRMRMTLDLPMHVEQTDNIEKCECHRKYEDQINPK